MRVPKREDQSLFILLFNCHTSIILALRGSVNPFSKFFSKWRRRESNPRLRWFRHAAFPESTTTYTPDKKKDSAGWADASQKLPPHSLNS